MPPEVTPVAQTKAVCMCMCVRICVSLSSFRDIKVISFVQSAKYTSVYT